MDIKALNTYIERPELLTNQELPLLEYVIEKYPYFQAARSLQLKILKDTGSYLYNQRLKETAAYTTDREVLFDFITSPLFKKNLSINVSEEIETKEKEEVQNITVGHDTLPATEESFKIKPEEEEEENEIDTAITDASIPSSQLSDLEVSQINDPDLFQPKETSDVDEIREELTQQPLEFDKNEIHSFNEWLKLSSLKVVHRAPNIERINTSLDTTEEKPSPKKKLTSELIDKFIGVSPKIAPLKKVDNQINLAKLNNTDPKDLMTETLAKVYLAQHNYKKAIQAYKILSLKNPEKSGFFADQIRKIEKLQANK